MINVNGIIINEKLIKTATPHVVQAQDGEAFFAPVFGTRIIFTDGTEQVFKNFDTSFLYSCIKDKEMDDKM